MADIDFLQETYIRQMNKHIGLDRGQLDALLSNLRTVNADENLRACAIQWKTDAYADTDRFNELPYDRQWPDAENVPLMPLIVLFAGADSLLEFYEKNGISRDVLDETLADARGNLDNSKEMTGVYKLGGHGFNWLIRHFTARLFHLGSLQYETIRLDESKGRVLREGDYVLNVHIPGETDLRYESVHRSYKKAETFFRRLYPAVPFKGFICESWMLSPQLKELMPESSNLVRFLSDYKLCKTIRNDYFFDFIYGKKYDDLQKLPESTTLQRSVKQYLLSGGIFRSGCGFLPLNEI